MAEVNNRILEAVFANGRPEVGLEVGTDAGLSMDEHIRIPRQMRKRVYVTTAGEEIDFGTFDNPGEGWALVGDGMVMVHNDEFAFSPAEGAPYNPITDWRVERPTDSDVRAFLVTNANHVRQGDLRPEQLLWVHAVRFWSVVGGLVNSNSSTEFAEVDNPGAAARDAIAPASVEFVAKFANEAFTAVAARAASWRKSNHATGGDIASGYPRRWMQKRGYWTNIARGGAAAPATGANANAAAANPTRAANLVETSAFYVATHAAGVHPVLAMMAGGDPNHFAYIRPTWGMMFGFDVKDSTRIRISEPTQVAGVAMVADSYVVLEALVQEGTAVLLRANAQVEAFATAYAQVRTHGIRAASYAAWFLTGHPGNVTPVAFNQKGVAFADLVGELGAVATRYMVGTTIAGSQALSNADSQLCSPSARDLWVELSRNKAALSNEVLVAAWSAIRGGSSAAAIRDLTSTDLAVRDPAVATYNNRLTAIAAAINVTNAPTVSLPAPVVGAVGQ